MPPNMTPLIVCGKSAEVAKLVRKYLLPEYDAIHIIRTPEAGHKEIPLLLSGKRLENTASNLGSQNYAQLPQAVVAGGGFHDDVFLGMREASERVEGVKKVPWLKLGGYYVVRVAWVDLMS
jgi:hypothetical protein